MMTMTRWVVICLDVLIGLTERKLKTAKKKEDSKNKQAKPRRMISMLDRMLKSKRALLERRVLHGPAMMRAKMKKYNKIHSIKVKEAMSRAKKSTIEDLQKDSTLRSALIQ